MRRPHGSACYSQMHSVNFVFFRKDTKLISSIMQSSHLLSSKASFYLPVFKLTRERFSDLISSGRVATRARSPWTVAGGHTGALPVVNSSLMLAASTYEDSGKGGILFFFALLKGRIVRIEHCATAAGCRGRLRTAAGPEASMLELRRLRVRSSGNETLRCSYR